jgi:hypothetical protein
MGDLREFSGHPGCTILGYALFLGCDSSVKWK